MYITSYLHKVSKYLHTHTITTHRHSLDNYNIYTHPVTLQLHRVSRVWWRCQPLTHHRILNHGIHLCIPFISNKNNNFAKIVFKYQFKQALFKINYACVYIRILQKDKISTQILRSTFDVFICVSMKQRWRPTIDGHPICLEQVDIVDTHKTSTGH